jgi:hypothetical protein
MTTTYPCKEALQKIAGQDDVELALDPQWAKRVAVDALSTLEKMGGDPTPSSIVGGSHPDDLAVDRFVAVMAERMKSKLAKKRGEGVTGWDDPEVCHIDYLVSLLLKQIHERAVLDPIDIANIAMMIHERGETPSHGR